MGANRAAPGVDQVVSEPDAGSRGRWPLFAALALLLLGLAAGLGTSAVPRGDEATYLSMVMSLRHDHDLRFGPEDLQRAFRIWPDGPRGVVLVSDDGGRTVYYDRPLLYPLAALPAYLLLGPRGLAVSNMLLYLLMVTVAWHSLERNQPGGEAGNQPGGGKGDKPGGGEGDKPGGAAGALLLGGFFFATAAFTRVFHGEPAVWTMTALFLALALWRRIRRRPGGQELTALAMGGLAAVAWSTEPLLALLALPVAADLAVRRRYRSLGAFLLAALLGSGLLAGLERLAPGRPATSATTQSAVFRQHFPAGEGAEEAWSQGLEEAARREEKPAEGAGLLARQAGAFLAGRHLGLLPYYPFALFCLAAGLAGAARDRSRLLLLLALAACCLVWIAQGPRPEGLVDAPGSQRFALLYPAFFWLLGPLRARWTLLLPFAAAGLWTAPAVAAALPAGTAPSRWQPDRWAAFRPLPLELDLVVAGALPQYVVYPRETEPGHEEQWWVPAGDFFVQEGHPNGVWVRGASSPEVVVAAPRRLDELRFRVESLAPDNRLRLESGAGSVVVRFDSPAKQWGSEIRLPVEPVARPPLFLYPFRLRVDDGRVPRYTLPDSRDPRYLGVFLDLTGGGL